MRVSVIRDTLFFYPLFLFYTFEKINLYEKHIGISDNYLFYI